MVQKGREVVKTYNLWTLLLTAVLFLSVSSAWAAEQPATKKDMPAILANLDAGQVTVLDDKAAKAVRGQNYQYVLVKTILNPLDFAPDLNWTGNLFGYRYGAWGGPGWTNGGGNGSNTPADAMDALFKLHDDGTISNQGLIAGLQALVNKSVLFWGPIYVPTSIADPSLPADKNVWVSGASLLGGKFFLGWRPLPFPEYSRREALTGMQLLGLVP